MDSKLFITRPKRDGTCLTVGSDYDNKEDEVLLDLFKEIKEVIYGQIV